MFGTPCAYHKIQVLEVRLTNPSYFKFPSSFNVAEMEKKTYEEETRVYPSQKYIFLFSKKNISFCRVFRLKTLKMIR